MRIRISLLGGVFLSLYLTGELGASGAVSDDATGPSAWNRDGGYSGEVRPSRLDPWGKIVADVDRDAQQYKAISKSTGSGRMKGGSGNAHLGPESSIRPLGAIRHRLAEPHARNARSSSARWFEGLKPSHAGEQGQLAESGGVARFTEAKNVAHFLSDARSDESKGESW